MVILRRTNGADPDFVEFCRVLTAYFAELNGEANSVYAPLNVVDENVRVVIATVAGVPVGCGALRDRRRNWRNKTHVRSAGASWQRHCLAMPGRVGNLGDRTRFETHDFGNKSAFGPRDRTLLEGRLRGDP